MVSVFSYVRQLIAFITLVHGFQSGSFLQCRLQILDQVLHILQSHRDPYEAVNNPGISLVLWGHLGMRRCDRVYGKAVVTPEASSPEKKLKINVNHSL